MAKPDLKDDVYCPHCLELYDDGGEWEDHSDGCAAELECFSCGGKFIARPHEIIKYSTEPVEEPKP